MRHHLKLNRGDARERALGLLRDVGIPEPTKRFAQYPHELSGGMRQRVSIAISLSCEPSVLIADEPTTALDVTVQAQILDLLDGLKERHHLAVILITHDMGVVAHHTDRVAVMYAGQLVEVSPTRELFADLRHPYTSALLASIPRIDESGTSTLTPIVGRPPDPSNIAAGCPFAPRCASARQRCLTEHPNLDPITSTRHVRCFFPLGTPEGDMALAHNRAVGRTAAGLVEAW
jgi:peptide/nickel transport system ATP-binding protein